MNGSNLSISWIHTWRLFEKYRHFVDTSKFRLSITIQFQPEALSTIQNRRLATVQAVGSSVVSAPAPRRCSANSWGPLHRRRVHQLETMSRMRPSQTPHSSASALPSLAGHCPPPATVCSVKMVRMALFMRISRYKHAVGSHWIGWVCLRVELETSPIVST